MNHANYCLDNSCSTVSLSFSNPSKLFMFLNFYANDLKVRRLEWKITHASYCLNVTGSKASFHSQKFNSILLHKMIDTFNTYPCTVSLLSNGSWSAFL